MLHTLADLLAQPMLAGAVLLDGSEESRQRSISWISMLEDDTVAARHGEVVVAMQEMREITQIMTAIRAMAAAGAEALVVWLAPELVPTVRLVATAVHLPVIVLPGDSTPLSVGHHMVEWLVREHLPLITAQPKWLQYLVDGATLPELLQALAVHWQRSVVLVDYTGYPVAHAGTHGQTLVAQLARWHANHLAEVMPAVMPEEHLFIVPLQAASGQGGSLVTSYQGLLPTQGEQQMVIDACLAVGLALQQTGFQQTSTQQRERLVWDLVTGQVAGAIDAIARGQALGFDVLGLTCAVVGQVEGGARQEQDVLLLAQQTFHEQGMALLGAAVPEQIALFIGLPTPPERITDLLRSITAQADSPLVISWGISEPFLGLAGYAKGYHDAQVACHLGKLLKGPGQVTGANQTGGYRILHKISQDPDSRQFWEQHLGALAEAEHRKGADLRETLEVYLATQCNASETARQLGLHRQTLNYRLQRIEEVTGCDLTDAQDRFALELSLRLYRLDSLHLDHSVEIPL